MITQIKKKLKKIKPAFSFFTFYYHVIRKSPKQYDVINQNNKSYFFTMTTPFIFFLISIIASIFLPVAYTLFLYLFIPLSLANIWFISRVDRNGREIERKLRYERMEAERMERERLRREESRKRMEEAEELHEWFRNFINEERRKEEEQKERMYREFFGNDGYQQKQNNQKQHTQRTSVDQSRVNAIKLLGLSDKFTMQELKTAYRKLSKIHHPDAPKGTEENFKRLNRAYNYLLERL